ARRGASARGGRLARARLRDCGDHLGGEGLAAAPLGVPRHRRRRRGGDGPAAWTPHAQGGAAVTRLPRFLLFALAALIQMGLIAAMVVDRARILRDGTDVTIQTRPVDPRDFLRGDYVALGYDFSNLPSARFKDQTTDLHNGDHIFVRLAPNRDGIYEMVS